MDEEDIPDTTVKMPVNLPRSKRVGRRTWARPSPYFKWFEKGITPEGEGYRVELPVDEAGYTSERRRICAELLRVQMAFNHRQQHKGDQLSHRVVSSPGAMYVRIVLKYQVDSS